MKCEFGFKHLRHLHLKPDSGASASDIWLPLASAPRSRYSAAVMTMNRPYTEG